MRAPLTPKQKALCITVAFCLNTPLFIFLFGYSREFSPRQVGVAGLLNFAVGVPLLALITEKWIRKLK
ncbi:MAG: hypothetical protein WAM13_15715 [Candidatus Sulfotelmatobacter sp.]|jgi:hypothetical protein